MKTTTNLLLAAALFAFAACSDKDSKSNDATSQSANTTAPAASNTGTTTAPTGDVALNPAHGEPGHDCAIPVGAPLNSTPQPKLTTPPPVFQPQPSGSVAAGTNPPHGQPGHDCAIPVGAPLPK